MSLLEGVQTCIHFNGHLSGNFDCERAFRQALSRLLLFVLIADGLNKMICNGSQNGLFQGLGQDLLRGAGLTHLQFADERILFLKAEERGIPNMKLVLLAFECCIRVQH